MVRSFATGTDSFTIDAKHVVQVSTEFFFSRSFRDKSKHPASCDNINYYTVNVQRFFYARNELKDKKAKKAKKKKKEKKMKNTRK